MQVLKSIGWVLLLYIMTIGVMVGAAYLWVWIYSVAFQPGEQQEFYEAYAQIASPVVAVLTALPVFYTMGTLLRRFEQGVQIAIAVVGIHWVVEILILLSVDNAAWLAPYAAASALFKAAGAWFALRKWGNPAEA